MEFLNNLFKCIPCGSKQKKKSSTIIIRQQRHTNRPRLSYKQGKVFYEDKSKKVFSALCTSTSVSGIGVVVKRFKIADPLTPQKVEACENLVHLIDKIKKIEHPNLVRYFEASYDLDTQYFEIITEQLPINLEDNQVTDEWHTKIYIMQILEAIEYLKSIGFTYLDIKLNNILFDHYGNLKIRDYIGNHYIEFLTSSDDSFDIKDESKLDIEADIKGFMNIIRNIGMYKIKFKNTANYNGLIFYLENLNRWNFSRIRADKFFNDIDQDGMNNGSVRSFAKTRTARNYKPHDPIFLTAEEPKNIFKGPDQKQKNIEQKLRDNGGMDGSDVFLKNLKRVQGLKKAKDVGQLNQNPYNDEVEILDMDEVKKNTGKENDIKLLRDMQKQLEDCFGNDFDNSSSLDNNKTQKIILNTIPSEYDDTPRAKRTPIQTKNSIQIKPLKKIAIDPQVIANEYNEKDSEIMVQDLSDASINYMKRSTNRSKEKIHRNDSMVEKSKDHTYLNQNRHLDDEDKIKKIIPNNGGNFKKKQGVQQYNVDSNQYQNFNTSKRTELDLKTDRSFDPQFPYFNPNSSPEQVPLFRNNSESQHDIMNVLNMLNGQKSMKFGSNYDISSIHPADYTKYKGNLNTNEIKNNSTQYYLAMRSGVQQGLTSATRKMEPNNAFGDVNVKEFYRDSWIKNDSGYENNRNIGGKLNFNL